MYQVIEEISVAEEVGDQINYESRPKELRWSWINIRTGQEWFIQLSQVKRLGRDNINTPIILDFINNRKNATETKKWLDKIDGLKVFI
jgi:hypothetical protein